jgi:hypothetical protein
MHKNAYLPCKGLKRLYCKNLSFDKTSALVAQQPGTVRAEVSLEMKPLDLREIFVY